jgi:fructokinase
MYAAIELGGTKVLCRAVADDGRTLGERRFATSTPEVAVGDVCGAIESWRDAEALRGVGVASFGPIVVDPAAAEFGRYLDTPKPGWSGFELRAALHSRLDAPFALDTDVNAAALAELELGWGAASRASPT